MGSKTMQVKGRWSLCDLLPPDTAPQRGSEKFGQVHLKRGLVTFQVVGIS
jgi:hypothetical protein